MKNLTLQQFANEFEVSKMDSIDGVKELTAIELRSIVGGGETEVWYDFGYFLGKAVKGIVKEMQSS